MKNTNNQQEHKEFSQNIDIESKDNSKRNKLLTKELQAFEELITLAFLCKRVLRQKQKPVAQAPRKNKDLSF